jgi:hypothetical protein
MNILRRGPSSRARRSVAIVATIALAATAALVGTTTTAAQSASTEDVVESDINPRPLPYAGWHQENSNERSHAITDDGLTMLGQSSVINGYTDNLPPLNSNNAPLTKTFLESVSYEVTAGELDFQIPLYFTAGVNPLPQFATLHKANLDGVGEHSISWDEEDWIATNDVGDITEGTQATLQDFLREINDYEVRGFGFASSGFPGEHGSVSSLTWDDTTYNFVRSPLSSETVTGSDIDPEKTLLNYLGWHQENEDADPGNAQVLNGQGLQLTGPSQVINGYLNAGDDPDTFPEIQRTNFLSGVLNAQITVDSGHASLQVPLYVRPEGAADWTFTTLYPGVPDGEGPNSFALTDVWKSSNAFGAIEADTNVPLGELVSELGSDYWVIAFGVHEDPTETSVVESLTWLDTTYTFANEKPTSDTVTNNEVASDEDPYAGWHQGYDADRQQVKSGGLVLEPNPSQVIRGEDNNSDEFDGHQYELLDVLRDGASVKVASGAVTFQIPLFFKDENGDPQFTTLRTEAQVLDDGVHQLDPYVDWKTSNEIQSANVIPIPAGGQRTMEEFVDAFRDYKVIAFGVQADAPATVTNLTWEGIKYVFKKADAKVKTQPKNGKKPKVTVTVTASDAGPGAVNGAKVTVKKGKKKVGSGKLNNKGKVTIALNKKKLAKGKNKLKASVAGTASTKAASKTFTVKVKK